MNVSSASSDSSVLVLASRKSDQDLALVVLEKAEFAPLAAQSIADLCRRISTGVGAVLLAEEALSLSGVERLLEILHAQPPWSDLPFVILTSGGRSTAQSLQRSKLLERLGHVTLLERPIRTVTLVASIRAALASRARQYEVRNQLFELVRQQEELRRSNAALEQFAYAAAHDLQEPIRNVSLYTQLLSRSYDTHLDPEAEAHMRFIVEGAERMQHLVEDLLAYTRAVNAPEQDATRVADTESALNQVTLTMQGQISQSGARLTHGPLPKIPVYTAHILQILQNLISNAIKYRSQCAPQIYVGAYQEGQFWHFTVKDNGIGIAPEFRGRIFGVFKRLHGREIPGNGIGLAICERIVHHYGGKIWVASDPNHGSEFHFTLPVLKNGHEPTATDPNSDR